MVYETQSLVLEATQLFCAIIFLNAGTTVRRSGVSLKRRSSVSRLVMSEGRITTKCLMRCHKLGLVIG